MSIWLRMLRFVPHQQPTDSPMNNITVAQCLQRAQELESLSDSARLDIELLLCAAAVVIDNGHDRSECSFACIQMASIEKTSGANASRA